MSGYEEPANSFMVPESVTQINFQRIAAQLHIRIEPGRCFEISVCSVIEMIGAAKDIVGGESVEISDTFVVASGGRLQKCSGNKSGVSPTMERKMSSKSTTRNRKGVPPVPRQ